MRALTIGDIAKALGSTCSVDGNVESYAIDSRLVTKGALFFALPGDQVDGHDYVEDALQRGAVAVVVSQAVDCERAIRVPCVKAALQALAQWVCAEKEIPIIGVTGSVGKTTTKMLIAQCLATRYKVYQSPLSYNSQLTLPLSVLNCPSDVDFCVLEYAMSEPGQMARLVEIAPPDYGVITPIGLCHAEGFADVEAIGREKGMLLRSPCMKQAFVHAKACSLIDTLRPVIVYGQDQTGPFAMPHLNENYQAAVAVAGYFGVGNVPTQFNLPKRRAEIVEKQGVTFFNDSYNACPKSFEAAFDACPKGKRQIGVIGSMLELGAHSKECHEKLAALADKALDHVLCVGEECDVICDRLGDKAQLCQSAEEAGALLHTLLQPGDVVLIKGSNSHALWRVCDRFTA